MRVAIFARDDTIAACLAPLAAHSFQVLGICADSTPCPIFAKRCAELGFDCTATRDQETVKLVVERFAPDVAVCAPDLGRSFPPFDELSIEGKYNLRFGVVAPTAPWPEFVPIWQGWKESRVALASTAGLEVAAAQVPIAADETAISLRMKHTEQGAMLLAKFLGNGAPEKRRLTAADESSQPAALPDMLCRDWNDTEVDRFLRASTMPPNDPARAEDPGTGITYFIENMAQFGEFQRIIASEKSSGATKEATYAADTHWYRITADGLRKTGDQSIHKPRQTKDGAFSMAIPGAAIKGGASKKLRLNEPFIGLHAERYCGSALASTWIGVEGPFVKRFEAHLARICGCQAACAVQSGTAACYGAMKALGVSSPLHHVLVPAFTCAAAADAVVHAGGTPIPIDSELDSFGVSAEAVFEALERDQHVVGVVVAPCYGVPLRDYHKIYALCKERGLWLCEDACESYGAQIAVGDSGEKVPLGSLSTLTVVSARSEKMIGVGEGGAILGNDTPLVTKARWWCSRAPCRGGTLWRVYEHEGIGQNFRLPEMLGAIGCAAAEMFPAVVERKRRVHSWYEGHCAARPELAGVRLQIPAPGDEPVWWVNTAVLPEGISAEAVGMQLMKDYPDIEIRPGFYPLDKMDIFSHPLVEEIAPCRNAELLYKRLIALPSSVHLQEADVERVCGALAETLKKMPA